MERKYEDELCVCGTKEKEIHVPFECKCYDLVRRRWMRTWDVLGEKERTMDAIERHIEVNDDVENDTTNKRRSCHSGHKLLCKLCRIFPPDLTFFGASHKSG